MNIVQLAYLVIRTLCGLRSRRRLESKWRLIGLRRSPTSLTFPKVFEASRDMNDRLWCLIL